MRINCTDDIIYHLRRTQFWDQLLARGYAEIDLSTYFRYDPLRSVLIAKIRTTPKLSMPTPQKTFFKIRHSPRTNQIMPTIKRALTAMPHMLVNRSLAKQLHTNRRPIIALHNSPKLAVATTPDFHTTGAGRHLHKPKPVRAPLSSSTLNQNRPQAYTR